MILPRAGSQRASAPIVPATAAAAAPSATVSASGPNHADATLARNAEARRLNGPTITMLSAAAPVRLQAEDLELRRLARTGVRGRTNGPRPTARRRTGP